jgi:hypothetical protein
MADIKYVITVDEKGAQKKIEDFDKAVKGLATTTQKEATPAVGGFMGAYAKLTATIAVGMAAYHEAKKAIGALTGFVTDSVKAAIESEEAQNNLRLALEATGHEVEGNALHFSMYAENLMEVTKYTDEQVMATQALLLQMGLSTRQVDEATRGAIGMASVFKIDLQTAAQLVGKAVEGNVTRFDKYIPQLKFCSTEAEKVALVHKKMGEWFGTAKGQVNTFGGQVSQLNKYWGELKESLGKMVTENKGVSDFIYVLTEGIKALRKEVESFQSGKKGVTLWDFLGPVAFMKAISGAVSSIADKLHEVHKPIHTILEYSTAWQSFWAYFKTQAPGVAAALGRVAKGTEDIGDAFDHVLIKTEVTETKLEGAVSKYHHAVEAAIIDLWKRYQINFLPISTTMMPEFVKRAQLMGRVWTVVSRGMGRENDLIGGGFAALAKSVFQGRDNVIRFANEVMRSMLRLRSVYTPILKSMASESQFTAKTTFEKWQEAMDKISEAWQMMNSQMTAIFNQAQRNREIKLENEYKQRLAWIMANVADEGERQKQIGALEAEYQIKRTAAARAAARQAKAVALMDAIVNVAAAITKSLTAAPFPFNLALAAATAALGAIQIALIRAQPIPLAAGAIFKKPTMLSSMGGNTYEVAEAGEAEIVSSPRRLREAIMGKGRNGMARPIVVESHIYIDGREIKQFITKTVRESGGLGLLGSVGKEMA